jgi:hypothetical protein
MALHGEEIRAGTSRSESVVDSQSLVRASGATLRRAGRILAAGLVAGVLTPACLHVAPHWGVPSSLDGPIGDGGWTSRTRAWFVAEGFHTPELDAETGHQFTWTGRTFRLVIPNLDRTQSYRLALDVSAGHPPGGPLPELLVSVDGVIAGVEQTSNTLQTVPIAVPPRRTDGLAVSFRASETFEPGPHDPRTLGVLVHRIELRPAESFRPTRRVAVRAGVAALLSVVGILLCFRSSRLPLLLVSGIPVGFSWLLLTDGALLGTFVDRLVPIGLGVAVLGAGAAAVRRRRPDLLGLPEWSTAVGLVLCTTAVKLALFNHPMATVGDGVFQVHRAELVHRGEYFFTSITPSPAFEFPYPVGLYVAALPLWDLFPSKLDLLRLLRGIALGADALVGLGLYAAARRQWGNPRAALLAAALWPFARAPVWGLCNANLTNVFGQSLFSLGMAGIAWVAAGASVSVPALLVTGGLLALAYLSHFGTLLVGVPLVCVAGGVLFRANRPAVRRAGGWVILVGLAAVAMAYAVYYSHFTGTYQRTGARIAAEEGAAPTKLVAPASVKFERWIREASDDYGLPGLPLAAVAALGAMLLARHRPREGLSLILAGWMLLWVTLTAVGILSPVQTRVNLAAAPMFVCLGAYGLSALAERSRPGAGLAAALVAAICWSGIGIWLACLGTR